MCFLFFTLSCSFWFIRCLLWFDAVFRCELGHDSMLFGQGVACKAAWLSVC